MDPAGKRALVTGASSGIGATTARTLAAAGWEVVLAARRRERLGSVAAEIAADGGHALVVDADLASEAGRARLFERCSQVDVLVNNAGFGWYGYFHEMDWSTAREMLHINLEAAVHLTRLYLPGMRARDRGHILNVGSISGSIPSQGIAVYSATKAFLDAFSTALHRETRGTNVHVSVVRAGPVRTEFAATARRKGGGREVPTARLGVSAERVARRIRQLLRRPRRVAYVPRWLALVPWLELSFGWLEDALGPLLLKYREG